MAEAESEWLTPTDNLAKAIDNERDTRESIARHALSFEGIYEGKI